MTENNPNQSGQQTQQPNQKPGQGGQQGGQSSLISRIQPNQKPGQGGHRAASKSNALIENRASGFSRGFLFVGLVCPKWGNAFFPPQIHGVGRRLLEKALAVLPFIPSGHGGRYGH